MDHLKTLAARVVADPAEERSMAALKDGLRAATDIEGLRRLAEEYTPHSEVSILIYERILQLVPGDVRAIVAQGFIFWLDGEDERGREQVKRAFELDKENVEALTLEAALTEDAGKQAVIYKKILEKEPGNRIALENLSRLGRSGE